MHDLYFKLLFLHPYNPGPEAEWLPWPLQKRRLGWNPGRIRQDVWQCLSKLNPHYTKM